MSLSAAQKLALLPADLRRAWLADQSRETLDDILKGAWWWVGRPEQFKPPGDWLVWLIRSGRGWGKALDVDTPVPTPGGWTTMGQLKDGDQVFTAAGHITTVVHAHPVRYDRPCFRLTFSDGCTIVADADHQWTARSRADRRAGRTYRTVTTRQMLDAGLTVAGESNWQMPAAYPLEMPDADLPIDPYVLGFWLGDGASAGSELTIGTPEDAEVVGAQFAAAGHPIHWRQKLQYAQDAKARRSETLHSTLRRAGLLHNKRIPAAYLRASVPQRTRLLEGLIDSDGYVEQTTGRIEITTIKEDLAEQVAELARTLGHRARVYKGRATLRGVDCGPKYRVVWVARSGGGRLPRKTIPDDRRSLGQPNRLITRYVTAIEPVVSRPVRCITVADPSELYLAGRDFLVTHNTRTGAEDLLDRVFRHPVDAFGQRTEWLVIAETLNDCRTACIEGNSGILAVLARMGYVKRPAASAIKGKEFHYWKSPKLMIEFASGQVIYFEGADNADVGRGYNAAGAWLDELAKWRYTYAAWYEGILPSLRAPLIDDHPRAVVTTTPKPIKLLIEWQHQDDGTVVITTGSIFDNLANLSRHVVEALKKMYEGTRAGLQELYGHLLEEIEGALWTRPMIENNRVKPSELPELKQTVVTMDPGASGSGDETGLLVMARGYDETDYVLADVTKRIVGTPAARLAWETFLRWDATWLVVETNMGKKWLIQVLTDCYKQMQQQGLFPPGPPPIKEVTSLAGKKLRAEPVAARYEQGRVKHVGTFVELEDQQCTWVPGEAASPDRIDALVQGGLFLMGREGKLVRVTAPSLNAVMPVSSPY